ncbi:MAG: 4-phosphopantetheinyl transferase superfamily protein [Mucilaginibacter sp.]|nr:4-phosphopantetheinyl transferase superfamily protein [Mucilaginibacter sp.]
MISTGNDIVALKAINIARSKEHAFYSKILSVSEKELYDQQFAGEITFENFLWLSWSIKESAYKYLQRITPELVFSPTKIIIKHLLVPVGDTAIAFGDKETEGCGFVNKTVYEGIVEFGNHALYSRSVIGAEFIASVVNKEADFGNTCWGIQKIESKESNYQSKAVRTFLLNRLVRLLPDTDLHIGKSQNRYPILFNRSEEMPIPVSLAHHDHYVAYSFQLK